MKILVLAGGRSGEHEVSLLSAASVVRHLNAEKHEIRLVWIDPAGSWWIQEPSVLSNVRSGGKLVPLRSRPVGFLPGTGIMIDNVRYPVDIVFPVLHGTFGEDGALQGFLEMMDLPYVGGTVLGSALGMDKDMVKRVWLHAGLPVVPFRGIASHEWTPGSAAGIWQEISDQFGTVCFVKPARCGSSVGIRKVHDREEFAAAMEHAFRFDTKVLVEPAVDAREIEVSVMGNRTLQSFVPGEILPSHEFYDYDAKYIDPDGAALRIPADLPDSAMAEARRIAEDAFRTSEARGLARVDFFLDRKTGRLLLNEINTMPGFTSISMFPRMCEAGGLAYPDLLEELVRLGMELAEERASLVFARE